MAQPTSPRIVGFPWYRPEQWSLLRALAADGQQLQASYNEWVKEASGRLWDLERQGVDVRKVDVDLHDLVRWCERTGRPLDAPARAEYANAVVRAASAPAAR